MRIGVVPVLNGAGGGIYQYSLSILRALETWQKLEPGRSFVLFTNETGGGALRAYRVKRWEIQPLRPSRRAQPLARRAVNGLGRILTAPLRVLRSSPASPPQGQSVSSDLNPDEVRRCPQFGRWFRRCGVDLMIYPSPTPLSFECGVPYVIAIHDLQHRLQPEFPEVSADGEYEKREYLFRNAARHAVGIMADSEVGREDIVNCYGEYGMDASRISVLPYVPPTYISGKVLERDLHRIRRTYTLPDKYLFYPAQFWPHKNHARIIQALANIKNRHGLAIPIVLCGSHTRPLRERTFREVMDLADRLGLTGGDASSRASCVRYLGFVPDSDMSALYTMAEALVMPTFFGPTNIPVLEAWSFGCPVLTSDIRGIRQQCGDAALLVDPHSADAIAEGIHRLWTEVNLRRGLIERGRQRLSTYGTADFESRFHHILQGAQACLQSRTSKAEQNSDVRNGHPSWSRSPAMESPLPS